MKPYWSVVFCVLIPFQTIAAAEPQPPRVVAVGFSDADYPSAAIRAEDEGTAIAQVMLGKDGRVTTCEVRKSSGSAILDTATCALLTTRTTFAPAHDARGRTVESSLQIPISWRLPARAEPPKLDYQNFLRSTLTAVRTGAGDYQECTERLENTSLREAGSPDVCRHWSDGMLGQITRYWAPIEGQTSRLTAVLQTGPIARVDLDGLAGAMAFQGSVFDPNGAECAVFGNVPIGGSAVSDHPGARFPMEGRSCLVIASPGDLSSTLRARGVGQWLWVTSEPLGSQRAAASSLTQDRFVVRTTARRLADGSVTDCRLEGLPTDGSCDIWTDDATTGPGLFASTVLPGEAVALALITDVRPWTGALQPLSYPGQREQVVLLGGETQEACARLATDGVALQSWEEVTACPLIEDPAAFFAALGDPRPRQSTWTLAAEPLTQ